MKLEKGQKIWVEFASLHRSDTASGAVATVIKAGSKYATVAISTGKEYKFNRVVWEKRFDNREVDACNYFATIYESESAWREHLRRQKIVEKFRSFCYNFRYDSEMPIEKIEAILSIIEKE